MGRRTMNNLKDLTRFAVLVILMLWCIASAGATEQQAHPQPPPVHAAQQTASKPMHGPVVPTTGAVHSRPMVRPAQRVRMVRPRPAPKVPPQRVAAKKPVEAAKPRVAETSAVPTAAALADQTPAFSEAAHGRDPFAALVRESDPGDSHGNLPPGIAGLQVATVRIEGMVKTPDGMVAVVQNPQDSVYFLHDGDHIFDGVVEKIGIDGITFRQESKDAFGRTVDRDVSKRLYPIAGDEQ
jgi:hypothetical protein